MSRESGAIQDALERARAAQRCGRNHDAGKLQVRLPPVPQAGARDQPAHTDVHGLVQASTLDNELNLPPDYIASLMPK